MLLGIELILFLMDFKFLMDLMVLAINNSTILTSTAAWAEAPTFNLYGAQSNAR